jgi:aspartate/methionine/tyrosine aminotransferase
MKLSPFVLERHFAKYEFDVPYQLSCSDCEPLRMQELLALATPDSLRLWETLQFLYTDTNGHPLLRKEIAEWYGNVKQEDLLVCVPEEGIYLVMKALLEKEDHLVVISPSYQSLYELAIETGCSVSRWEADEKGIYQVETLKSLVNAKTRLVVINFPHNPSGTMISRAVLEEIVWFCDRSGILVFSDEMYRGLEQNPGDRLPCASSLSDFCISLSGMSKTFALPGLRIGWLSCSDPVIFEKLLRLKDYTTICSSAPSEILSLIALQSREMILNRNLAIIKKNISLVNEFVRRYPSKYSWTEPKAGSVAMLNILTGQTSEEFCQAFLEKKQVLAIGSHLFNMPGPAIRLGLGRIGFAEALAELSQFTSEL